MNKYITTGLLFCSIFYMISCSKEDENKCFECSIDGVEICEVEDGRVRVFENGEALGDPISINNLEFNDAAEQLCAEIERQVGVASGCYECSGPNVPDFDLCETNEGITLDGELIPDTANLSLADAAQLLEDNPNDAREFQGLSCSRN